MLSKTSNGLLLRSVWRTSTSIDVPCFQTGQVIHTRPHLPTSRAPLGRTAAAFKGFGAKSKLAPQKKGQREEQLPCWELDSSLCPCCSGKAYAECCQPYHDGEEVPTPEAVMRARFSAYVKKFSDFIVATTHPENPAREGSKAPDGKDSSTLIEDINATFRTIAWQRLRVLGTEDGASADEGKVQFEAYFKELEKKVLSAKLKQYHRRLEGKVRDAGEEAWLGREAPEDPELDGPEEPLLALPSSSNGDGAAEKVPSDCRDLMASLSGGTASHQAVGFVRKFRFRSLRAAVAAARDGDQILLKRGIHNGLGETVHVSKRVLIRGEGTLGETRIDQRANCPALRIGRTCVGLDIDMTGFNEAVKIEGPASVRPAIQNCIIRCSGDDALNVCGKAAPVFESCTLQARKCGVRAYERARVSLTDCKIEACGEQAIKAFEWAEVSLSRSMMVDCEEDGIVALDQSNIRLETCTISGCKGPAVDLTNQARLQARQCTFTECVGALWVWDDASADVADCRLQADKTYVVLADGKAVASLQGCTIHGKSYSTQINQLGAWRAANQTVEPGHHIGAPPEESAFEFVPNKYTRRQ
ncbi:g10280 [Coccomyxa elongata]